MSTGAMAMRLLVPSYRKLRNVRQHRAAGHVNIHVARALAALLSRHEIDFPDIGDEVGMKNAAVILGEVLAFFGEKFGIAGIKTVFEHIIRVEDKLGVAEKLERHRLAGERKI